MVSKNIINRSKEVLKKEGLKCTTQRTDVLIEVMNDSGHRECDEILVALNKDNKIVSRATLYRTLDIMEKYEFLRKMDIGDGKFLYEKKINKPHHDHMIDVETGEITEFFNEEIETIQNEVAAKHGFKIIKHIHQLFVKKIK